MIFDYFFKLIGLHFTIVFIVYNHYGRYGAGAETVHKLKRKFPT